MDKNYFKPEMKLKIVAPIFKGDDTTNHHHIIRCVFCPHEFVATPKSKKQNFKRHGIPGCPKCTDKVKYEVERKAILERLEEMGIILLESYSMNKNETLMKNTTCCNRPFKARPDNVLNGRTICPPCNTKRKRKAFQQFNIDRHEEALQYKEGLDKYTNQVRVLTEATYRERHQIINPNKHPRLRAGQEGGYHLDHIKSISECFHADIPPEECAHHTNLQMLPYAENISKGGSNRNV